MDWSQCIERRQRSVAQTGSHQIAPIHFSHQLANAVVEPLSPEQLSNVECRVCKEVVTTVIKHIETPLSNLVWCLLMLVRTGVKALLLTAGVSYVSVPLLGALLWLDGLYGLMPLRVAAVLDSVIFPTATILACATTLSLLLAYGLLPPAETIIGADRTSLMNVEHRCPSCWGLHSTYRPLWDGLIGTLRATTVHQFMLHFSQLRLFTEHQLRSDPLNVNFHADPVRIQPTQHDINIHADPTQHEININGQHHLQTDNRVKTEHVIRFCTIM